MNKRKIFGTILGIIVWCCCIVFFTYAWYSWRSGNLAIGTNSIVDEKEELGVVIENSGDVIANNIGPVLNLLDGVTSNFVVSNYTSEDSYIYVDLQINLIDEELLSNSFEYMIVKCSASIDEKDNIVEEDLVYDFDNPVDSGNFENFEVEKINIGEDIVSPGTVNYYKVIFYIDGNQKNDLSLMNKSMQAVVMVGDSNYGILAYFEGIESLNGKFVSIVNGEPFGELPEPVVENFIFEGWYLEENYETLVTSETIVSATDNIILYGKLTKNYYNISYNLNGGTIENAPLTEAYIGDDSNKIIQISEPSKSITITASANGTGATTFGTYIYNYDFKGWTSNNIDVASAMYGNSATNLRIWDGNTVVKGPYFKNLSSTIGATVNLNANWDASSTVNLSLSKKGYTCNYNTVSNGSGTSYSSGSQYAPSPNSGNVTLYVFCTANTYNVNYNGNGSDGGSTNSTVYTYDSRFNLNVNGFTKTGYHFKEWNTKADGSGVSYGAGQSVSNLLGDNDSNITLYAIWEANTYNVNFYDNLNYLSVADVPLVVINGRVFYKKYSKPCLFGYLYKDGYTGPVLVGESADAVAYYTSLDSTVFTSSGSFVMNGITYYYSSSYNWMAYNLNDSSGLSGIPKFQDITIEEAAKRLISDNSTTKFQSFNFNISKNLASNTYSRSGYNFLGWSLTPTGSTKYTDAQLVSNLTELNNGEVNLYANWAPKTIYSVTYNTNGGIGGPVIQYKYHGVNLNMSSILPTREGYIFRGWSTSSTSSSATYGAGDTYTVNSTTTLYAVWGQYLNNVAVGSYVAYTGNNGCSGSSCIGQNANYVNSSNMGYCNNTSFTFDATGWRVAYVESGVAYLVSAGAVECMSSNSSGVMSSSVSSDYIKDTNKISLHINNLNSIAIKYCNTKYIYGGSCNINTVWALNANDYDKLVSSTLPDCSTYSGTSLNNSVQCGYSNSLVDNGGYYWFANNYQKGDYVYSYYHWSPNNSYVGYAFSHYSLGVRPVVKIDEDVIVISGDGSSSSPYQIDN